DHRLACRKAQPDEQRALLANTMTQLDGQHLVGVLMQRFEAPPRAVGAAVVDEYQLVPAASSRQDSGQLAVKRIETRFLVEYRNHDGHVDSRRRIVVIVVLTRGSRSVCHARHHTAPPFACLTLVARMEAV